MSWNVTINGRAKAGDAELAGKLEQVAQAAADKATELGLAVESAHSNAHPGGKFRLASKAKAKGS